MTDKSIITNLVKSGKKFSAVQISPVDDDKIKTTELKSITVDALKLAKTKTVAVVLVEL
jgi:hypothetical protein